MNYEQAYKEALERAKKLHGCPEYDAELEEIFPELCESEDEKARRTLVEYFGAAQLDTIRGVPIQKIRDWLEKQKGQKPAGWSKGDEGYLQLVLRLVTSDLGENNPTVRWLKAIPGRINPQPRQEQPELEGVVHHSLEAHWIVIDDKKKLTTVLKKFSEGTKVKITITKEESK